MGDQGQIWQAETTGGQVTPGEALAIAVPSGQVVTLQETIWNAPGPEGLVTRFRFLAPAINPETAVDSAVIGFDAAAADLAWLCQNYALDRVVQTGAVPAQIILSFEDRPLPFGEAAPDAVQYFEAFRVENGSCIWEVF